MNPIEILDPPALTARARKRLSAGDKAGAAADLNEALRLDPNLAAAYHVRAGLRIASWQFADALVDANRAVELKPDTADFHLTRANVHYHLRDAAASEADYAKAFALDADDVVKQVLDYMQREFRNSKTGVLKDCENHLRHNPADTTSLMRRATFLLLLGRDAEAEADYAEYRRLNPGGSHRADRYAAEARKRRAALPPS